MHLLINLFFLNQTYPTSFVFFFIFSFIHIQTPCTTISSLSNQLPDNFELVSTIGNTYFKFRTKYNNMYSCLKYRFIQFLVCLNTGVYILYARGIFFHHSMAFSSWNPRHCVTHASFKMLFRDDFIIFSIYIYVDLCLLGLF